MGAAQSSNVAEAVANVTNYVDQSTTANASQVNELSQEVDFSNCVVNLKGDMNINEKASLAVKSNQILSATQDANVSNDIQQQMLQETQR